MSSSVNVFICTKLNIFKNLISQEYKKIIIEQFIPGRIQAAIIGKQKLGAIELKPKENFMIIKLNIILRLIQNILFL